MPITHSRTLDISLSVGKEERREHLGNQETHWLCVTRNASGLFEELAGYWKSLRRDCLDSIGLYKRPLPEQMAICEWWMQVFGISSLKDKMFLQISSGEQRLALLARAFVKDPELLILDEPLTWVRYL